ncbi:MAG: alpha/beta hydrolase [Candidatus Hodarchaeales archaeon]
MKFKEHQFPIGIVKLHPDGHLNMHLNWALAVFPINLEDIKQVVPRIKNVKDGKKAMLECAEEALKELRIEEAAYFHRFAEFFTSAKDEDKGKNFSKFIELFYSTEASKEIETFEIPYEDYYLRAIHLKPDLEVKGQIVWFGGSDSVLEDFLAITYYLVKAGYELFLFEGPGQGEAIYEYGKPFIVEWEKPVKAVLDFFELKDVTLIGTSFGGWLVLRAAAFEPRVSRVIAFDIFYDYYECFFSKKNFLARSIFKLMLKTRAGFLLNALVKRQMRKDFTVDWLVNFGSYINGVNSPYEYFKQMEIYNAKNHKPSQITQDILLLAGEEDHFIPPHLLAKQKKVLTNARSVTCRLFTKEENAELHCQIGNMKLALDFMKDWIKEKT